MPATPTAPPAKPAKAQQPTFWKNYSPGGECPISVAGSLLLHLLPLAVIVLFGWWILDAANESSKPPQMDVVEIEGSGGGLGGNSEGPGMLDKGDPGRHEAGASASPPKLVPLVIKVGEYEFKDVPSLDLTVAPRPDETPDLKDDPFAAIERERAVNARLLAQEIQVKRRNSDAKGSGFKGGDKFGPQGGAGGPKGSGVGKGPGPGQGTSSKGSILTDQRRRELRWKIKIPGDIATHLKTLQALKVTLIVQSRSRPDMAISYDLSKPNVIGEPVKFKDHPDQVRWYNSDPRLMADLNKALNLGEAPLRSAIVLPRELEDDMAKRELAYQGREEWEIEETYWEILQHDGIYDNVPSITRQSLRSGVR